MGPLTGGFCGPIPPESTARVHLRPPSVRCPEVKHVNVRSWQSHETSERRAHRGTEAPRQAHKAAAAAVDYCTITEERKPVRFILWEPRISVPNLTAVRDSLSLEQ